MSLDKAVKPDTRCEFCHEPMRARLGAMGRLRHFCSVKHRTYNIQIRYLTKLRGRLQQVNDKV